MGRKNDEEKADRRSRWESGNQQKLRLQKLLVSFSDSFEPRTDQNFNSFNGCAQRRFSSRLENWISTKFSFHRSNLDRSFFSRDWCRWLEYFESKVSLKPFGSIKISAENDYSILIFLTNTGNRSILTSQTKSNLALHNLTQPNHTSSNHSKPNITLPYLT